MNIARPCLGGLLILLIGRTLAVAQPVLEEVEKNVRRQVGAPALVPADGDPSAPAAAQPGYLGVVADDRQEEGRGIRIREVMNGGPAAKGGLQIGDLITTINGRAVHAMSDMAQILGPLPPGQAVDFQVDRAGAAQKINVVLGSRPAKGERRFPQFGKLPEQLPDSGPTAGRAVTEIPLGNPGGPLLGVRSVPLTFELRRAFKVAESVNGALVSSVTVGSPADKSGIAPGMVITAVNGQPVVGPDVLGALVRQAGPGQEIEIALRDQNGESRRRVTLAGAPDAARPPLPAAAADNIVWDPSILPGGPMREGQSIEALERRIQQLESRVEKLEAALRGKP